MLVDCYVPALLILGKTYGAGGLFSRQGLISWEGSDFMHPEGGGRASEPQALVGGSALLGRARQRSACLSMIVPPLGAALSLVGDRNA